MNLSNLPSTSALAYIIFVTCLGKFVIILSLHKYCSHTHDETKIVERRKMYFHIYTPQVIYKKSSIQWLLKVLQKESVLSRILWPSHGAEERCLFSTPSYRMEQKPSLRHYHRAEQSSLLSPICCLDKTAGYLKM